MPLSPSASSERCRRSSTRTTRSPLSPSDRGRRPSTMHSTKCSHSSRSGSTFGIAGRVDVAAAGDVLAVAAGVLVEALVVDRDLALERHVVEGRHPLRADDREAPLLVRVEPGQVQVRATARTGSAGSRTPRPRLPAARRTRRARRPRSAPRRPGAEHHRDVVRAEAPERVLVGAQLAEVQPVAVDVVDPLAELARVGQLLELPDARVVLEQVADHQHPPESARGRHRALGVGDRLRQRLLDEAVLAGLEHPHRELRVRRDRRRERDRVELRIGEQLVEIAAVTATPGKRAPPRSRASGEPSQHHASSRPGTAAKLRARFGPQ